MNVDNWRIDSQRNRKSKVKINRMRMRLAILIRRDLKTRGSIIQEGKDLIIWNRRNLMLREREMMIEISIERREVMRKWSIKMELRT